jgi:hypothetical protein
MTNSNTAFRSARLVLALGLALTAAAGPAFARGGSAGGSGNGETDSVMKPYCMQQVDAASGNKAKQKTGNQPQAATACR